MKKRKRKNHLALLIGLALILVVLLGTLVFATANSDDNGNGEILLKPFRFRVVTTLLRKKILLSWLLGLVRFFRSIFMPLIKVMPSLLR
ncbi:MAG: hypothetical protein NHB14_15980 [Desulfosporosinus sp.]|nr:hypothetical protein [Desulfosporosinus sp.]